MSNTYTCVDLYKQTCQEYLMCYIYAIYIYICMYPGMHRMYSCQDCRSMRRPSESASLQTLVQRDAPVAQSRERQCPGETLGSSRWDPAPSGLGCYVKYIAAKSSYF